MEEYQFFHNLKVIRQFAFNFLSNIDFDRQLGFVILPFSVSAQFDRKGLNIANLRN